MTFLDEIELLKEKIKILQQPDFFKNNLVFEEFIDRENEVDLYTCFINFKNPYYNQLFEKPHKRSEEYPDNYLGSLFNSLRYDGKNPLHNIIDNFDINVFLIDNLLMLIKRYKNDIEYDFCNSIKNVFSTINSNITDIYLEFDFNGLRYKVTSYNFEKNEAFVSLTKISGLPGNFNLRYNMNYPNQKVIEIPNSFEYHFTFIVNSISPNVFDNMYDTEKIILPNGLEDLRSNFWNCRSLKYIECESKKYKSLRGILYSNDFKKLIAYPNKYNIFYDIPEGVEIIEKDAFKCCDNIEVIRIPTSIKIIRTNAFYQCCNLKILIFNSDPKNILIEESFGNAGLHKPDKYIILPEINH